MIGATKIKFNNEQSQILIPIAHIQIYFSEKGWTTKDAIAFYSYYTSRNWKYASRWKPAAFRWMLKLALQQSVFK